MMGRDTLTEYGALEKTFEGGETAAAAAAAAVEGEEGLELLEQGSSRTCPIFCFRISLFPRLLCREMPAGMQEVYEWAILETHNMAVRFCCPCACCPLHGKSLRRQTEAFYVRWNPLYYLVFIFAAICIVVGRIEHSIICSQGQPVRGDETDIEKEIRIHWIYFFDGFYALFLLKNLAMQAITFTSGTSAAAGVLLAVQVGAVGAIFMGNACMIHAMRQRSVLLTRAVVVAVLTFGLTLAWWFTHCLIHGEAATTTIEWVGRACLAAFFAWEGLVFLQLWSAYRQGGYHHNEDDDVGSDNGKEEQEKEREKTEKVGWANKLTNILVCTVAGAAVVFPVSLLFHWAPSDLWNALA